MRVAALDFGTNSFLCLIAEAADQKITRVLWDGMQIVRLGQGIYQTNRFHPEALSRVDDCLSHFRKKMDEYGVTKVLAVATSAARDVENKQDLIDIGNKYQIPIEIISGDLEAELTFGGATQGLEKKEGIAVIDVGGGSTEIMVMQNGAIEGLSLNIGCVRLLEGFISGHPVKQNEMQAMIAHIQSKLTDVKSVFANMKISKVIAVAGTPTALAAMDLGISFDANKIENHKISVERLEWWERKLSSLSISERIKFTGLEEKRADVIVVGVSILKEVARFLATSEIIVSTKGVRFGLIENQVFWK